MKRYKKVLIIVFIGIAFILQALDFVPVKFAVQENTGKVDTNVIEHVFTYEPKTLGPNILNWVTEASLEQSGLTANIIGVDPFNVLNAEDFHAIHLYNASLPLKVNRFVFSGEFEVIEPERAETEGYDLIVYSANWDILYPISRLSYRGNYVSKNYLTIYDYDWSAVLKSWFSK